MTKNEAWHLEQKVVSRVCAKLDSNQAIGLKYWWKRFDNLRSMIKKHKKIGEDVEEVLERMIKERQ